MQPEFLTTPELKKRDWTDTLIRKFLTTPDETRPNPKYQTTGSPMKLYRRDRVEQIEGSTEFRREIEKTRVRKVSAKKGVTTKQAKMDTFLSELVIDIPFYEKEQLLILARRNFRSLGQPDSVEISDERMCVNYLRHCESEYEAQLTQIAGKIGSPDAYFEIKEKVLDAIAFKYDWLAEECTRQLQVMRQTQMNQF
jgi:hypothetical protein